MEVQLLLPWLHQGLLSYSSSLLSFPTDKTDCPIRVYFVIDTSESIALQTVPIQSLVNHIKSFIPEFITRLENELYQSQVSITWQFAGLHYSDVVIFYSDFTNSKEIYLDKLKGIQYIGRGTFTDCALSNMTAQILANTSPGVNYAVVITDGHVTGSPCGGMKLQAERARDAGIKLFVVAPSDNIYEQGLREIANSPLELYRNNYSTTKKDSIDIDVDTIDRIIQVMVSILFLPQDVILLFITYKEEIIQILLEGQHLESERAADR